MTTKKGQCQHARGFREPVEPENPESKAQRCTKCGHMIKPRAPRTFHGTTSGHEKHKKERKGEWQWPPCESCGEARKTYARENNRTDKAQEKSRQRTAARNRAFQRLRVMYPRDYAKLYSEELALMQEEDDRTRAVRRMRAEITSLLRRGQVRNPEVAEKDLRRAAAGGYATVEEKETLRRVGYLRFRIGELESQGEEVPGRDRK